MYVLNYNIKGLWGTVLAPSNPISTPFSVKILAWNATSVELARWSNAHSATLMSEMFLRKIEGVTDPNLKRVLRKLSDMFILTRIEKDVRMTTLITASLLFSFSHFSTLLAASLYF